jgi:hypothetical protein
VCTVTLFHSDCRLNASESVGLTAIACRTGGVASPGTSVSLGLAATKARPSSTCAARTACCVPGSGTRAFSSTSLRPKPHKDLRNAPATTPQAPGTAERVFADEPAEEEAAHANRRLVAQVR